MRDDQDGRHEPEPGESNSPDRHEGSSTPPADGPTSRGAGTPGDSGWWDDLTADDLSLKSPGSVSDSELETEFEGEGWPSEARAEDAGQATEPYEQIHEPTPRRPPSDSGIDFEFGSEDDPLDRPDKPSDSGVELELGGLGGFSAGGSDSGVDLETDEEDPSSSDVRPIATPGISGPALGASRPGATAGDKPSGGLRDAEEGAGIVVPWEESLEPYDIELEPTAGLESPITAEYVPRPEPPAAPRTSLEAEERPEAPRRGMRAGLLAGSAIALLGIVASFPLATILARQSARQSEAAREASLRELEQLKGHLAQLQVDADKKVKAAEESRTAAEAELAKARKKALDEVEEARKQAAREVEEQKAEAARLVEEGRKEAEGKLAEARKREAEARDLAIKAAVDGRPSDALLALAGDTAEGEQGAGRGRRRLVSARLALASYRRIPPESRGEADSARKLDEVVRSASEARDLAAQADDRETRIAALLVLGRALEAGRRFDQAIETYQEGLKQSESDREKGRFQAGLARARAGKALSSDADATRRSSRGPLESGRLVTVLIALQPAPAPDKTPEALRAHLKEAEQAAERNPSPETFATKGFLLKHLGDALWGGPTNPEAADDYRQALRAFDEAMTRNAAPDLESEDALDASGVAELLRAYSAASGRLATVSESSTAKQLRERAEAAERALGPWSRFAGRLAEALALPDSPGPGDSPERLEAWRGRVLERVASLLADQKAWLPFAEQVARALKVPEVPRPGDPARLEPWRGRVLRRAESYVTLEERLADASRRIAGLFGYRPALPRPDATRPEEAAERADAWAAGLIRVVGTSAEAVKKAALYREAEADWARRAQEIAYLVHFDEPLADDDRRWASPETRLATERWMADLVEVVKKQEPSPGEADRRRQSLESFGRGLDLLQEGAEDRAIAAFDEAIRLFPKDARYFYFRAIARYQSQAKGGAARLEDAVRDVRQGVRLERANSPGPYHVARSLTRIQFQTRDWLESFRAPGSPGVGLAAPISP